MTRERHSDVLTEPTPSMGESAGLGQGGMRLVVAPAAGRLKHLPATRFHEGDEWVSLGQPIAQVEKGPTLIDVVAPVEARLAGVLVRDGEPVAKGQPLVWLEQTARPAPDPNVRGDTEGA
jgi:biotin carboxyl carrier protein